MDAELEDLLSRLRQIESDFEQTIDARRAAFRYRLSRGRVVFEEAALAEQRRVKVGMMKFLRESATGALLLVPFVYLLIVPLALLDFFVWIYQRVCFPVWRLEPVKRADYIVLDRHRLAYLNAAQKLNCVYCGYANGLIAYVQEVAALSEQYWCPIKHAVRVKGAHRHYRTFLEYGDFDNVQERIEAFRSRIVKAGPR
jgi:hypothetical protein